MPKGRNGGLLGGSGGLITKIQPICLINLSSLGQDLLNLYGYFSHRLTSKCCWPSGADFLGLHFGPREQGPGLKGTIFTPKRTF